MVASDLFQSRSTNGGAKGALAVVAVFTVLELLFKLYRRRIPLRLPAVAG